MKSALAQAMAKWDKKRRQRSVLIILFNRLLKKGRNRNVMSELTAYEITYSDGSTSRTSMASGVTIEQAEKYFIGQRFDLGMYGMKENIQTAVKVKKIR